MDDFKASDGVDQHEIITLRRGALELGVAPTIGGALSRFDEKLQDGTLHHWFRPATAADASGGNVLGMAHFPLVPVSGRIADGELVLKGERFSLPRNDIDTGLNYLHGEGWHAPWQVSERQADRLRMELRGPVQGWPFRYLAWQEIALRDDGLYIGMGIRNEDRRPWPAGLGLHPWFPPPMAHLKAQVADVWYTNERLLFDRVEAVPDRWNFSAGRPLADSGLVNGFGGWDGVADLQWSDGRRLRIEATGVLRQHLMIFTLHPSGAWCIEPVSHVVDGFNLAETQGRRDTGTIMLEPGQEARGAASFRLLGRCP